ncbi:MAG: PAS domain-containing protein [Acidobacteria bacterium]|nr:PAS domain-containing protein [Acidobacteriota bacterium]
MASTAASSELLGQLENSGDGVFAVGLDQKILCWNRAAQALLGFRSTEVLGQYCYDVIAGCNGNERRVCRQDCRDCQKAKRGELIPNYNLSTRNKAKETIWINISPILVKSSEPMIVHVFRDITDYIRLKEFVRKFSLEGSKLTFQGEGELTLSAQELARYLVKRLENLGHKVILLNPLRPDQPIFEIAA